MRALNDPVRHGDDELVTFVMEKIHDFRVEGEARGQARAPQLSVGAEVF